MTRGPFKLFSHGNQPEIVLYIRDQLSNLFLSSVEMGSLYIAQVAPECESFQPQPLESWDTGVGARKLNPGPLQGQQALLTTESSF